MITRREFLSIVSGAGVYLFSEESAMAETIIKRPVPKSGELLPVIGLGTWQAFDVGASDTARAPLRQVLSEFVKLGGSAIDSSPMYGKSETVAGDLAAELALRDKLFIATKVWTTGRDAGVRQMNESFRRLRTQRMDLMQVHNLVDYRVHLSTLRQWREQGKVRYLGVTHYTAGAHDEVARVLMAEELDFVQINYSLTEREAENRLLPLAADKRIAVLANRPLAAGGLFSKVRGKPLPAWANEIGCKSWAQFFLKFVVSHPAVTCAIPATSKLDHLLDNMQAGFGTLPEAKTRQKMAEYVAAL